MVKFNWVLHDEVDVDMNITDIVTKPGSHVMMSPPQTQKSFAKVALMLMAYANQKPCVVTVLTTVDNGQQTVDSKISDILDELVGDLIKVQFFSGKKSDWDCVYHDKKQSSLKTDIKIRFLKGEFIPIVCGTPKGLEQTVKFLRAACLPAPALTPRALWILDEADLLFLQYMSAGMQVESLQLKVQHGLEVLGFVDHQKKLSTCDLSKTCFIDTVAWVSATQLGTLAFHMQAHLPAWHYFSNPAKMVGFADSSVLKPPTNANGADVFMDAEPNPRNWYGLRTEAGQLLLNKIHAQSREADKKGVLCLVSPVLVWSIGMFMWWWC
jgi:hypothetical protein